MDQRLDSHSRTLFIKVSNINSQTVMTPFNWWHYWDKYSWFHHGTPKRNNCTSVVACHICQFIDSSGAQIGIPTSFFRELILRCTLNVQFLFDRKFYREFDGAAMSSLLGPFLANIFMAKLEQLTLSNNINDLVHWWYFHYSQFKHWLAFMHLRCYRLKLETQFETSSTQMYDLVPTTSKYFVDTRKCGF